MLTMNAKRVIFLLALCYTCMSLDDEQSFMSPCADYSELCETQTLSAPLGSSVLLSCTFSTSGLNQVSWTQIPEIELIHHTSKGRIKFLDPRHGRVKAFPNQVSEGNYSIGIDELKNSDMGCYRCRRGQDCLQVELVTKMEGRMSEKVQLVYIFVGVALILLTVCSYFCITCILSCINKTQDNSNNPVDAGTGGASAPSLETGSVPAADQQRGVFSLTGADNLVYENDDQDTANQQGDPTRNHHSPPGVKPNLNMTQHTQSTSGIYPNLNQFNFERAESQRTKQRFHADLFNRLRQASRSRHYYVNQGEISKQQAMSAQGENQHRERFGKKKVKENCEYKNPIYSRSTDQLNHL